MTQENQNQMENDNLEITDEMIEDEALADEALEDVNGGIYRPGKTGVVQRGFYTKKSGVAHRAFHTNASNGTAFRA